MHRTHMRMRFGRTTSTERRGVELKYDGTAECEFTHTAMMRGYCYAYEGGERLSFLGSWVPSLFTAQSTVALDI
jgi:hypothetical protein